ncbi:acid phosphatase [Chitinimonas sp. PSY-7]
MNDDKNKPVDTTAETTIDPSRRKLLQGLATVTLGSALPASATPGTVQPRTTAKQKPGHGGNRDKALKESIKTVVVIYLENRSFNNLFGDFPGVASPMSALTAERYRQIDRNGQPFTTLPKVWGGMVQRRQEIGGQSYLIGEEEIKNLPNSPFRLNDAQGKQLPTSVITRDLWHLFYQNQMQINDGRNDQFVAWGNSGSLVMGHYGGASANLNLWRIAREYTLCDNFFMGAFGGSYLNHQYLVACRPGVYPDAANSPAKDKIAVVEGAPEGTRLKLSDKSPASAMDGAPKFVRDGAITPDGYIVNTLAPAYQPSWVKAAPGGDPKLADPADSMTQPVQTYPTIGDLLSAQKVSWAWYGGGWGAALEGRGGPNQPNFQSHHQPFNYFKSFAPGTEARKQHLRDGGMGDSPRDNHFIADALAGKLPAVTFYKPQGNLNLHAGYSDIESGDQHIGNIISHLQNSPQWKNMLVVITFDENGGWWDHVSPPKGDRWGPGSRIPALVISPYAKKGHVDHTYYDTSSIARLITRLHDLPELEGITLRNEAFKANGGTPPGDLLNSLDI